MATKTLTATFTSPEAAAGAAKRIERYGVGTSATSLDGNQLRACVDDAYCELVLESLRESGAEQIAFSQNQPESEDWINHHGGRTTSAGVPPGQGDAEAGVP